MCGVSMPIPTPDEIDRWHKSGKLVASVFGLGYVGLCLSAFMAQRGIRVVGVDVSEEVVEKVRRGETPFFEPGLEEALKTCIASKMLEATTDSAYAVESSNVIVITVGTPLGVDGSAELRYLRSAAEAISSRLRAGQVVVLKSTVPPGATEELLKPALEHGSGLKAEQDFALAFCPERLSEGRALEELAKLPVVVGAVGPRSRDCVVAFFRCLGLETIDVGNPRAAELVKLADNLWIDVSIALGNLIALFCETYGADVRKVISAANTLSRGYSSVNILNPGLVGGSCLPKDPLFLAAVGEKLGIDTSLIVSARNLNSSMYLHVLDLLRDGLLEAGKEVRKSRVAVLGLAFKGETSDTRESQSLKLIERLVGEGARVVAFDPYVKEAPAETASSVYEAVEGADAVVVATEHRAFQEVDWERVWSLVKKPCVLVDARGIVDPNHAIELGFIWRGLGRPPQAFQRS